MGTEESRRGAGNFRLMLLLIFSILPWLTVSADTISPRIVHQIISEEVPAGQPYTFRATVTDNDDVAQVMLNYKNQDAGEFQSVPMISEFGSADYTAELPAASLTYPGLDYFITAIDNSGNRQFRGFDFDPLKLGVFAPVQLQAEGGQKEKSGGSRTVWYVVGAVALIGLAAAAGGGSGKETGSGSIDTIVLDR